MKHHTSGLVRLQVVKNVKVEFSRFLRKEMTIAESILWNRLRNRQVCGCKFRRQQILFGFIADFYCEEAKLVIEVDGGLHETKEQIKVDLHKDDVYKELKLTVLRVTNNEIENDINSVIMKITKLIVYMMRPHPQPLSCGRGVGGEVSLDAKYQEATQMNHHSEKKRTGRWFTRG
jgi:very-short-patch-repair endonuclease